MTELVFSKKYPKGVLTDIEVIQLQLCIDLLDNGKLQARMRGTTVKVGSDEEHAQYGRVGNFETICRWVMWVVPQKIGKGLDNPEWARVEEAVKSYFIPELLKFKKWLENRPARRIPVSSVIGSTTVFSGGNYRTIE